MLKGARKAPVRIKLKHEPVGYHMLYLKIAE